jgi:hypothetical protein
MMRGCLKPLWTALIALALVLSVAAADVAYYYPRLPERIATHFGPSGDGDRWENKADSLSEAVRWGWFPPLVIVGSGLLSGLLIRYWPGAVSLPNKNYWTAPEHRTYAALLILGMHLWFLVLLLAFILGVTHLTFVANLSPAPRIDNGRTLLLVAGFLAAIVAWLVVLIRKLYYPPSDP